MPFKSAQSIYLHLIFFFCVDFDVIVVVAVVAAAAADVFGLFSIFVGPTSLPQLSEREK